MSMLTKSEFETKLDTCYNEYSHEGEFDVQGWKIIVFRKQDEYMDCGAFVFKKDVYYFTDWFEGGDGDLKAMMDDVLDFMFKADFKVKIKVIGELDEDFVEDNTVKNLKNQVFDECKQAVEFSLCDVDSLKISVNKKDEKFSATFLSGFYSFFATKNNDDFFSSVRTKACCNAEMMFVDKDVKDFAENAFNFKQTWF